MDPFFKIIGHRGAPKYCHENTLSCFEQAYKCKATAIEFDLRQTKDKEIIVIHDPSIDRVTTGSGEVRNMSLKEIRKYNIDGERIPTLREVFEKFSHKMAFDIEIKVENIEKKVIEIIEEYNCKEKVLITSFLPSVLRKIREIDCDIKIGVLIGSPDNNIWKLAKKIKAYAIVPNYKNISEELIAKAHRLELKIFPWTVNDKEIMIKLLRSGVDGIITDDPCLLASIVNKSEKI
ncbi:MAG: hypothetical protein J7K23_03670 [Thermoproteales archaeon]|nr:hypothetical protein [Thermoproteales archaeon]